MSTQNVPVTVPANIDDICQRFGGSLPDLVKAGFAMVIAAYNNRSEHLAVLTNQPNWNGTYTIQAQLNIRDLVAAQQGGGNHGGGTPTI